MHNISIEEHQLIGDIYDAALDARLWPNILTKIATHTQAKTANIIAMDQLNPAYNLFFPHNIPEQCLMEYQESGWNVVDMKVVGAGLAKFGVGVPHTSIDVFGSIENVQKEYGDYYGFLQKWGMTSQLGALLDHGDFRWSVVGIHRPEEMGVFGADAAAFLERITAHIRRALQIHRQLMAVKNENTRLYTMLDAMVTGVLLLGNDARIHFANPRAARLIAEHEAITIQQEGLRAQNNSQNTILQKLIRGAIETSQRDCQGSHGGVMGLNSPHRTTPLMLSIVPLSSLDTWQDLRHDNIAAAIFLTDPDQGYHLSDRLLQDHYQLSPREISICQYFINTPNINTTAEHSGLSTESVRTYLKAIYEKTGQHSQAELIRLLMGLRVDFEHIR